MMDNSDDLQNRLDRIGQRKAFGIDWAHFRELAVLGIVDLCALSVGIHPEYAQLVRGMTTLDPEEIPKPEELKALAAYRNDSIAEWERRVCVAVNNIKAGTLPVVRNSTPFGGHDPYEVLPSNAEEIVVKVADFVPWVRALGWALPDGFPCPTAAGGYPMAPEGLQVGGGDGGEDKPLASRAETTYLNIIGGLLALMLGKSPAGNPQSVFDNQAAIISALLAHHADKPGIAQRTLEEKFAAAKRSLTGS